MISECDKFIYIRVEFEVFKLNISKKFKFNSFLIYTEANSLIIEGIIEVDEIDEIDQLLEFARYFRPQLLIIEGILSYFSGIPFTVYSKVRSSTKFSKEQTIPSNSSLVNNLIIDGEDFSDDLNKLLNKLHPETGWNDSLVITLLDKWRKAIYMEKESEVNTYHEEAILTHFHIFELIASEYEKKFEEDATKAIEEFTESFSLNLLNRRGESHSNTKNSKTKILKNILIKDEKNIATSVKYFLKKYNILDEYTDTFINNLVKMRNFIAHGRISYREKVTRPLPPFFHLFEDSAWILRQLSIFTARAIAFHLDLDKAWVKEWEMMYSILPPSNETLASFIKNELIYESVNAKQLINGEYKRISVRLVIDYYIKNPKKRRFFDLDKMLGKVIKEVDVTEESAIQLLFLSILLSDSKDDIISKIAQKKFITIYENDWYEYLNVKDILRYLDFYDIKVTWFKKWLIKNQAS